jgi:hypothetical protein
MSKRMSISSNIRGARKVIFMLESFTAEEAAVYGAYLSSADLITHKPDEDIGKYAKSLSLKTLSDHHPEKAAVAASFVSARVFSSSASSGSRLPIVSISKTIPKNSIVVIPESNQEVMESVILGYKISEKMSLPSTIVLEYPKFEETVRIPNMTPIKNFLQKPKWANSMDIKKPITFSSENNILLEHATPIIKKTEELWKKKFHRSFGLTEGYKIEDAKKILVMAGFHFPTCKIAVDSLRSRGEKVGALRIRTIMPFPDISKILSAIEFSTLDNKSWGPILSSSLSSKSSFLYNKYLSEDDFVHMLSNIGKEGTFNI